MSDIYAPCDCGSGIKTKWCCGRQKPSQQDIKTYGMVMTPPALVNEMLDRLPQEFICNPVNTGMDPCCGDGNFLVELLNRRMKAGGISHSDALKTLYGIDIVQRNVNTTRHLLALGSENETIWSILNKNIICADALDDKHWGWKKHGYLWNIKKFDFITMNPPYNGRKVNIESNALAWFKSMLGQMRIGGKWIYEDMGSFWQKVSDNTISLISGDASEWNNHKTIRHIEAAGYVVTVDSPENA